jgi:hypothetical protein
MISERIVKKKQAKVVKQVDKDVSFRHILFKCCVEDNKANV